MLKESRKRILLKRNLLNSQEGNRHRIWEKALPQLSGNIIGRGSWAYGSTTILIERKGEMSLVCSCWKREKMRKIRRQRRKKQATGEAQKQRMTGPLLSLQGQDTGQDSALGDENLTSAHMSLINSTCCLFLPFQWQSPPSSPAILINGAIHRVLSPPSVWDGFFPVIRSVMTVARYTHSSAPFHRQAALLLSLVEDQDRCAKSPLGHSLPPWSQVQCPGFSPWNTMGHGVCWAPTLSLTSPFCC